MANYEPSPFQSFGRRPKGSPKGGTFTDEYNFAAQVFGVGNFEFLDSEANRAWAYWRAQEYGTRALIGHAIGGLWGGVGGGRGARHGQSYSAFGEGGGQQFIPFAKRMDIEGAFHSAQVARWIISGRSQEAADHHWAHKVHVPATFTRNTRDGKGFGRHRRDPSSGKPTLGIIENPIVAKSVYSKGLADFDLPGETSAMLSELIGQVLNAGHGSSSPRSLAEFPGMMSIQVISDISTTALRQASGNYQRNLREANRRMAARLADRIAASLEIKRPGVSTGQLRESIVDPRNRIPQ